MGDFDHGDPAQYSIDLDNSLQLFEDALIARYEAELDEGREVWTPHGTEPPEPPPLPDPPSAGPPLPPNPDADLPYYREFKERAPEWAAEVRPLIEEAIPVYDAQDLDKVGEAADDVLRVALILGRDAEVDDDVPLRDAVNRINGQSGNADAFTTWSGISGWSGESSEALANNFGQFVAPTMNHQSAIAASLVNLYVCRANLVSVARNNVLVAIDDAAAMLHASTPNEQSEAGWLGVKIALIAVGTVVSTPVGVALAVGSLAAYYIERERLGVDYEDNIEAIVDGLIGTLNEFKRSLDRDERMWPTKVDELERSIADTDSADLELYDFTSGGSSSSAPPADGFDVDVDQVKSLAAECLDAAVEYEVAVGHLVGAEDADAELTGRDNDVTDGDRGLKKLRDQLLSFLQTTCARYHEAARRLTDAASEYFAMEIELEGNLAGLAEDPDLNGELPGIGAPVEEQIQATARGGGEDGDGEGINFY